MLLLNFRPCFCAASIDSLRCMFSITASIPVGSYTKSDEPLDRSETSSLKLHVPHVHQSSPTRLKIVNLYKIKLQKEPMERLFKSREWGSTYNRFIHPARGCVGCSATIYVTPANQYYFPEIVTPVLYLRQPTEAGKFWHVCVHYLWCSC